ncbi:PTS sugar transporter subunit IIA [Breznakia pachnodae]|uniref:Glucose-specific phosphotransferase system IIA component n=1 Tax=Breznakia pachnodae TaxID=265178 RepID=A0ABU0E8H3_9FIRM|nr:PTS glucose transporter subunit IIA [Breznakia pachnodae]MDQ0363193.1 glucose-specific phosphotransferase system IIA component [Breznakia pachnodae]
MYVSYWQKKTDKSSVVSYNDNKIVALADATQILITDVNDEVFASKAMGDGVAFKLKGDTIYAPASGKLSVLFPTGHAFGIAMNNGVELLCHIGINTVEANGKGFTALKTQGDYVIAGEPVIKLDLKELEKTYDMTTMLIVVKPNEKQVVFNTPSDVRSEEVIAKII